MKLKILYLVIFTSSKNHIASLRLSSRRDYIYVGVIPKSLLSRNTIKFYKI